MSNFWSKFVFILLLVAFLGAVFYSSLAHKGGNPYPMVKCQENLLRISIAKESWARDNNKQESDTPSWNDLVPKYLKYKPVCPLDPKGAGRSYTIGRVKDIPKCNRGIKGREHVFPSIPDK